MNDMISYFGMLKDPDLRFPDSKMYEFFGNKGSNLHVMHSLGLPVPAGFVISKEALPLERIELFSIVDAGISALEFHHETKIGEGFEVSVRSGSSVSMPGMMDTFLCLDSRLAVVDAIKKVYESWWSDRAKTYRKINNIPDRLGTAATIQTMVYGDRDQLSYTGVLYTRDPKTGKNKLTGEFLCQSKGVEIVDGSKDPIDYADFQTIAYNGYGIHEDMVDFAKRLEWYFKTPQDIEWTVESGELWFLQTRAAKMSPVATAQVAYDMAREGIITKDEALCRVDFQKMKPKIHVISSEDVPLLCGGIVACEGVATGEIVSDNEVAAEYAKIRRPYILLKTETRTEDVAVMADAKAVITRVGGLTSHAAAVARQMNKPCIVGTGMHWHPHPTERIVTVDANHGKVFLGFLPFHEEKHPIYEELLSWKQRT